MGRFARKHPTMLAGVVPALARQPVEGP
jgi:hypothetical protein